MRVNSFFQASAFGCLSDYLVTSESVDGEETLGAGQLVTEGTLTELTVREVLLHDYNALIDRITVLSNTLLFFGNVAIQNRPSRRGRFLL